ncbi:hypothetical protein AHF37_00373 [Paragonimus kellicotti]|nr:hypothetical protein AHF37_00373 [Paragonimus kellicotti]
MLQAALANHQLRLITAYRSAVQPRQRYVHGHVSTANESLSGAITPGTRTVVSDARVDRAECRSQPLLQIEQFKITATSVQTLVLSRYTASASTHMISENDVNGSTVADVRITHDDRPGTTRMIHRIRMTVEDRLSDTLERLQGYAESRVANVQLNLLLRQITACTFTRAQHMHPSLSRTIQFTPQLTTNINLRLHTGRHTGPQAGAQRTPVIGNVVADCWESSQTDALPHLFLNVSSSTSAQLTSGFLTRPGHSQSTISLRHPLPSLFCHVPIFCRQQVAEGSARATRFAIANQWKASACHRVSTLGSRRSLIAATHPVERASPKQPSTLTPRRFTTHP